MTEVVAESALRIKTCRVHIVFIPAELVAAGTVFIRLTTRCLVTARKTGDYDERKCVPPSWRDVPDLEKTRTCRRLNRDLAVPTPRSWSQPVEQALRRTGAAWRAYLTSVHNRAPAPFARELGAAAATALVTRRWTMG
jgi:hypothetical protein